MAQRPPLGAPHEEIQRGTRSYLTILERLHRELAPRHYLEIGVRHGTSLALARGRATGVDPEPDLRHELPPATRIVSLTSDEFFARESGGDEFDFAFIDGMHHVEFALRDFMNVERRAAGRAVVAIDDVFPNHPAQAERQRRTRSWTGDVWRLAWILERFRPDLFLTALDVAPAGMLVVAGLDPANRVLWDAYDAIVREASGLGPPPASVLTRARAVDPDGPVAERLFATLAAARAADCASSELVARLRGTRAPPLSVVVAAFNMARELPRTIRSLSPSMQRDIAASDYEVILVDNGSTQPFDETALRRLLPGLIIHRMRDARVSPARALNAGLELARGDLVGVWIDGARIASPRLLARALAASKSHPRPVVGTVAFHLGPDVQRRSMRTGYDQRAEDRLLADCAWEADPYRLFAVSVLGGSSAGGWFDLPSESSAFFLRAAHWRDIGGWDERFESPGGGYLNLSMWRSLCADTSAEIIMLLGEATFHQFHGGVMTNAADSPLEAFREEYRRIHGAHYERPQRQPLFFGSLPPPLRAGANAVVTGV